MSDELPTAYDLPDAFGYLGSDIDWSFLHPVIEPQAFGDGEDYGLAALAGDANNVTTRPPNFGMNHAQAGSDHMSDPAEAFAGLRMSTPPAETVLPTSIRNIQNNTNFQGLPSEVPVQAWAGGDTPDGSLMETLQTLNQHFDPTEDIYSPVNQAFQSGPAVQYGPGLQAPTHPGEAIAAPPHATVTAPYIAPDLLQDPLQPLHGRQHSRSCFYCGKTLSRPGSLRRHLNSSASCPGAKHRRIIDPCPRCNLRGFPRARPDSLKRHLQKSCPARSV